MLRGRRFPCLALAALILVWPAVMKIWSANVSYRRSSETLLIVPARPAVLQLAFDLARMRDVMLVSFRTMVPSATGEALPASPTQGKADADKPLLHIWTGSDWQYLAFDDFCSLRFVTSPPGKVIVIGDDQTVPKALLQGMSWADKIERLPSMNAADLINGLDPYFQFSPREWKRWADSYGLKLEGANAPQAKQSPEASASRPGKDDVPPAAPAAKRAAPSADNEVPRARAQDKQPVQIPSPSTNQPVTVHFADSPSRPSFAHRSGLREGGSATRLGGASGEAWVAERGAQKTTLEGAAPAAGNLQNLPAKDNKFRLHLGEDEYILFVWIAPLSIWVGQYEVTNAQYDRFDRAHDPKRYYDHILNLPDQPAVLVSWEDANNYCGWLNRNFKSQLPPGFGFRLPTEKEWTVFAACGREVKYPWGDQWPPPNSFNYKGMEGSGIFYNMIHNEKFIRKHEDGFVVAAPVSKSGTNAWGLYGVGGNVWEWCQDWFDETKMTRVLKGAAWNNYEPAILAISNRSSALPEKSNAMIGFRVVIAPRK